MFFDIYEQLCKENNVSLSKAAVDMGISKSAVSMWKKKGLTPRKEQLLKIANYFGVSVDSLLGVKQKENVLPALTKKDEQDIEKELQSTLERLETEQGALMFSGEPLDEETKQLLAASLRNSLEFARRTAQQKYTPKKYRKD